jgi:hypothetical protein
MITEKLMLMHLNRTDSSNNGYEVERDLHHFVVDRLSTDEPEVFVSEVTGWLRVVDWGVIPSRI